MIPFTAYISAETLNVCQWARQPPKISHSHGGISTPSNTWFLGPTSQPLNSISIGSAIFVRLTHVPNKQTDTQTDWPHYVWYQSQ